MLPVDVTTYLSFTVNTAAAYACYPGTREPEVASARFRGRAVSRKDSNVLPDSA